MVYEGRAQCLDCPSVNNLWTVYDTDGKIMSYVCNVCLGDWLHDRLDGYHSIGKVEPLAGTNTECEACAND